MSSPPTFQMLTALPRHPVGSPQKLPTLGRFGFGADSSNSVSSMTVILVFEVAFTSNNVELQFSVWFLLVIERGLP